MECTTYFDHSKNANPLQQDTRGPTHPLTPTPPIGQSINLTISLTRSNQAMFP